MRSQPADQPLAPIGISFLQDGVVAMRLYTEECPLAPVVEIPAWRSQVKKALMTGYCHGVIPAPLVRAGFRFFDLRAA